MTGETTITSRSARSAGRLEEILHRHERLGLAVEAGVGHARARHQVQHALDEGRAGAQHRREHQLLAGDAAGLGAGERRLDLDLGERQIARHLVAQQHADLFQQLAEGLGRARLVADQRQLVLHQRMLDHGDAVHALGAPVWLR